MQKLIVYIDELNLKKDVIEDVNKNCIDEIVNDVSEVFLNAAKKTFGIFHNNNNEARIQTGKSSNKDWFSKECKQARKDFRKCKRLYKHYGSNLFRERLRISEKNYKRIMDENIKSYNNNLRSKMKNLRSKNPREFWKIWNKRSKSGNNIDIESLFNFFKEVNTNRYDGENYVLHNNLNENSWNNLLNDCITAEEVMKAVRNLKNNKSPGDDMVVNEYISSTIEYMIDIYVSLFNLILDTGVLPRAWLIGNVISIYKNKGNKNEPQNYRPITLLSSLGKLFTSILNSRLCEYLDESHILLENQAGFRQGHSTNDHIFSIYAMFELLKLKKKKLFCAFIDFEKAFDLVQRNFLLYKLLQNNIDGKFFLE